MSNDDEYKELQAAAVLLLSSINGSSLPFPDSKDKLFTSSQEFWPLNACIDKFNGSYAYASGYLDAARVLARLVIFSRSKMDSLIYPIVFLYRHYLELTLKSLIRKGLRITNTHLDEKLEGVLEGHDLARLWTVFKPFFEEVSGHNEDFDNVRRGMESYINQVHCIDKQSTAFRYDRKKNGTKHSLESVERINILILCENMEKLTCLLGGIENEFDMAMDCINDMRM